MGIQEKSVPLHHPKVGIGKVKRPGIPQARNNNIINI